jgi:NADH-quinone oxidoreductase subunit L
MTAAILILLIILVPWTGAMVVSLLPDRFAKAQHSLAVIFSILGGIVSLALLYSTVTSGSAAASNAISIPMGAAFGNLTFLPDGLAVFLAVVASVIGCLAVVFSVDYMRGEKQLGRYYAYVLFFIGGMSGLVLTSNMLFLFFFWEITALCSYVLISFNNDDPKAVAGGIKALIITQIGGIGLLAGALVIHLFLGTYDISVFLAQAHTGFTPAALAVIAFGFLAAAAAKSAQFPFQTWLPDAMEAPTPISALIHAATMVNAGVYLLARFYPAFADVPYWKESVVWVGVITALLAAFMALVATDLKRVLAYSTVSQLGYMVYAIGAGGIFASQFHLFSHALFKALLFLGAGAIIHSVGTRDMTKMGGLWKKMPWAFVTFIIGALALSGIPILNGFWSKELLLESGFSGATPVAYYAMLIGAGLTALYTFRMVDMVFFGKPATDGHVHDAQPAMRISLALLAAGSLVSWMVVGRFCTMLAQTLPFHEIDLLSLRHMGKEILYAPNTYIALGVVALGLLIGWQRARLSFVRRALQVPANWASQSFGFEWINRRIVSASQGMAEALRITQTGDLNWNAAYIVFGLILTLGILLVGR